MSKALIIVESPAKIKTLRKFLGPGYQFDSSIGHIRDLPEREFGIDLEHDFEPKYTTMPDKEKVIAQLIKASKKCDTVYLCTDPDREGEAIAWHIEQILPSGTKTRRAVFHEITKRAVQEALMHPRGINYSLVNAQQLRRILDRIVGYKISPVLNRRVQRGVSAGRVQSVALKLVVDREKEIDAFTPVEYWNLGATLKTKEETRAFQASLYSVGGKPVEKQAVAKKSVFLIETKKAADEIKKKLEQATYRVQKVTRREKKRHPVPPFITSSLQQEASRHHYFSSSKTMSIAQTLYEGIDLGNEGAEGLITYMRTDSVRIATDAQVAAREYISDAFGSEYLPAKPKNYSTKKSAQDAHEAIRPTNVRHTPEAIKKHLTKEQFFLYSLIWKRFLASQMNPALYDTVSVEIDAGNEMLLRASGSQIKFSGFLVVYEEKKDDEEAREGGGLLPNLEESLPLDLVKVSSEQAFTRPPPRFSEASLVKELEKSGIGRPSTYASIMNKIQSREYTTKEKGRLHPTELGQVIAQLLETNFSQIMDVGFTANMEDELELVAENKKEWKAPIRQFWKDFEPMLQKAEKEAFVPKVLTDQTCPKCGEKLQKIWSKSKYFYGCSAYPECDYSAPIEQVNFRKEEYAEDFNWDQPCPQCGQEMVVRHGRFGAFLGCSTYPTCRGIVNIPKKGEMVIAPEDLPKCPAAGCPGQIVSRKSRYGKTFFACSTFPECDIIGNDLSQIASKYTDHPRTPYEKKQKKAAEKKGKSQKKSPKKTKRTMPSYSLSKELEAVVHVKEATRGNALKLVWDYIKKHNLQDPKDKRVIRPDALLGKVFGSLDPVGMFKVAGLISPHIGKK